MKKTSVILAAGALLVSLSQAASAMTFVDSQKYFPTWGNGTTDDGRDIINHPEITGGSYFIDANRNLTSISFNNVTPPNDWSDLYTMDLFINVVGSANDTVWDYIVRGGQKAAGSTQVFDISNAGISAVQGVNDSVYDIITEPSLREGHLVSLKQDFLNTRYDGNPFGINYLGDAYFTGLFSSTATYTFDQLTNPLNLGDKSFIIGWGVNCANDVIYEELPVPEPGTIVLLGAGLLGLGFYTRRRVNK